MTAKRAYGLDVLRAAAILMVLAAHYPKTAGGGLQTRMLNFGWVGVDLFFVLSGYLIGRQLLRAYAEDSGISLRNFYVSRLMRTLPCYYAILAVYLFLGSFDAVHDPSPFWRFATFLQNFGIPGTFTPSWSLCVEEHFYAIFPLAVLFHMRFGRREDFVRWIFMILALEIAVRATLWLAIRPDLLSEADALSSYLTYFYYPTFCRLDGIVLGVGLAALQQLNPEFWKKLMASGLQLWAASILSFCAAVLVLWQRYSFLCCTIGFTLICLCFFYLTAAILRYESLLSRIRIPGVGWIAALSYSIYLTHALAIEAGAEVARRLGVSTRSVPGFLLMSIFLASFAVGLYRGVERPMLAVRARLLDRVGGRANSPGAEHANSLSDYQSGFRRCADTRS